VGLFIFSHSNLQRFNTVDTLTIIEIVKIQFRLKTILHCKKRLVLFFQQIYIYCLNKFPMENLINLFENLRLIEQIYWTIAIPASIAFLIQLVFAFIGGDSGSDLGDVDTEIESDFGIEFQFLTLRNLIAFFTIFSWTGIACLDSDFSNLETILISFVAGIAMMLIMASLMYYLSKLQTSGTLNIKSAIGHTGTVYLPIPGERQGVGKVQLTIQGSLHELSAVTAHTESLPTSKLVRVTDVLEGNLLLVEPFTNS